MKLSEELKIKRAEKVARMQAILDARKENGTLRAATTEETTEYDGIKAEVARMDTDISEAEGLEARGTEAPQTRSFNIGGKADKTYNIGKAIREYSRTKSTDLLTGLEKEQHQRLFEQHKDAEGLLVPWDQGISKRASDTTTNADSIDNTVYPGLSIIGKQPLWAQMGFTVLPGLQGVLKLGAKDADIAGQYAEKADITATSNKATFKDLSPIRFGSTDLFPRELIAQENPAVHQAYINDLILGCDRKFTSYVYAQILAAATAVDEGALSVAGFDALMGAVEADGSFVMSRSTFFKAKAEKVDAGSGKFLVEMIKGNQGIGVTTDGVDAFYSTLFTDATNVRNLTYGAMSELWVGIWGAVEILINPYSYQSSSQTQITVNKLMNGVVRNDAAFRKSPDLDATT
jgi:hypothetical protein